MSEQSLLLVGATAFGAACLAVLVLARLAPRLGLIDHPGGRKRHHAVVPLVGGIAIYLGVLSAYLWLIDFRTLGLTFQVACGAMVLVGVADDHQDITPTKRLALQSIIAVGLILYTGQAVTDLGDLFGLGTISLGWAALPFTIVAMVALINAFNMMDGLDGLAGGVGVLAFAAVAVLATLVGRPELAKIAAAFTGAIAGFLLFNAPIRFVRRRLVFMGDAGSTLLGFAFAGCAMSLVNTRGGDIPPALILWLVAIPIFELFSSTFRRAVKGMSPMEADTGHYHHRLTDAGWPVAAIASFYFLFSAVSVGIGLGLYAFGTADVVIFLAFLAWFGLWNVFVMNLPGDRRRQRRLDARSRSQLAPQPAASAKVPESPARQGRDPAKRLADRQASRKAG